MAMYFSRRKTRVHEPDDVGELNIVPYLDIMMNLVMFMLLTMTALAALGILNVTAPKYGPTAAPASANANEQKLTLTVGIAKAGFYIAGGGGVLPGEAAPTKTVDVTAPPRVPLKNGLYDYDALTAQMVEIKKAFPQETRVIITADPNVEYETLVATMDAVRENKSHDLILFYDVSLAQM
jgi:biopolymer transport protein TolR